MQLPIIMLVDEHKLIIQAVDIAKVGLSKISQDRSLSADEISIMVDFFRTYVDRFHHGKEEGILFSELSRKQLSETDKKLMNELIEEHVLARRTVKALEQACQALASDKEGSLDAVKKSLETLTTLYPAHIEKEERRFFHSSTSYFSSQEQEEMLTKFREFDQSFTDKRYSQIIGTLQKG